MGILCKGWLVFSQPLRLLVALPHFIVVAGWNCSRRATVWLGIDTLIANILVFLAVKLSTYYYYYYNHFTALFPGPPG